MPVWEKTKAEGLGERGKGRRGETKPGREAVRKGKREEEEEDGDSRAESSRGKKISKVQKKKIKLKTNLMDITEA
jgi:hypothetical protein